MEDADPHVPLDRLDAILRVSAALNSEQDLDTLLPLMAQHIREGLGYAYCSVLLVEGADLVIRASTHTPQDIVGTVIPADSGVTRRCARTRQPVLVPDTRACAEYIQVGPETFLSELAVPILYRDRLLGVLNTQQPHAAAFDDRDRGTLGILATQLGIALHNARMRRQLSLVQAIGLQLATIIRSDELFPWIVAQMRERLRYESCAILRLDGDALVVEAATGGYAADVVGRRIAVQHGITGRCARWHQPINVGDTSRDPDYIGGGVHALSEMAAPVLFDGQLYGVLTVESQVPDAFDDDDLQLLSTLSAQTAVGIRQAQMFADAERMAVTDALTGLYNHRYFYQRLGCELARCTRFGRPLALVLLDLDDFKAINDHFGHLAGDEVLRSVARVLNACTRGYDTSASVKSTGKELDVASRYGGEEFVLIMPETRAAGAAAAAERIRLALEAGAILGERRATDPAAPSRLTASFGVAEWEPGLDAEHLIKRADEATYAAKAAGKDRVVVWGAGTA